MDMELICDEVALEKAGVREREAYNKGLLDFVKRKSGWQSIVTGNISETGKSIKIRLGENMKMSKRKKGTMLAGALVICVLCSSLFVACGKEEQEAGSQSMVEREEISKWVKTDCDISSLIKEEEGYNELTGAYINQDGNCEIIKLRITQDEKGKSKKEYLKCIFDKENKVWSNEKISFGKEAENAEGMFCDFAQYEDGNYHPIYIVPKRGNSSELNYHFDKLYQANAEKKTIEEICTFEGIDAEGYYTAYEFVGQNRVFVTVSPAEEKYGEMWGALYDTRTGKKVFDKECDIVDVKNATYQKGDGENLYAYTRDRVYIYDENLQLIKEIPYPSDCKEEKISFAVRDGVIYLAGPEGVYGADVDGDQFIQIFHCEKGDSYDSARYIDLLPVSQTEFYVNCSYSTGEGEDDLYSDSLFHYSVDISKPRL